MFKRPESVLVVVHTDDGQVLQLLRREPQGFWQSVTGSLKEGETPLKAARRELREETGLDGEAGLVDGGVINRYPIHPAWRHRFAPDVLENTEYVFHLAVPEPCDISLSPEHMDYRWLPREQAAEAAGSATDKAAILALLPARPQV
ncbi:MAG TPA: dihydroneopterin triphosphate diphosphatase [Gammaproteobacteria bacterium]|nr:dihydroneopterin triphosphate diphosphatase [Gammaproteobacteria bacterium]